MLRLISDVSERPFHGFLRACACLMPRPRFGTACQRAFALPRDGPGSRLAIRASITRSNSYVTRVHWGSQWFFGSNFGYPQDSWIGGQKALPLVLWRQIMSAARTVTKPQRPDVAPSGLLP